MKDPISNRDAPGAKALAMSGSGLTPVGLVSVPLFASILSSIIVTRPWPASKRICA